MVFAYKPEVEGAKTMVSPTYLGTVER